MQTCNVDRVVISYVDLDGKRRTIASPACDADTLLLEQAPPTLTFGHLPHVVVTIKADSPSIAALLGEGRSLPTPIDIRILARRPKQRRHARGGLRRMVAPRCIRCTAHEMTVCGDNTGDPWTFSMAVSRRRF